MNDKPFLAAQYGDNGVIFSIERMGPEWPETQASVEVTWSEAFWFAGSIQENAAKRRWAR